MKTTSSSSSSSAPVISRLRRTFFVLSVSLFLFILLLLFLQPTTTPPPKAITLHQQSSHPEESSSINNNNNNNNGGGLQIRPGFTSYDVYIQHQLSKTQNPKLRQIWMTRDWDRKIDVFSQFFTNLKRETLLSDHSKSLCIGARVGQEVVALRRIGVSDSVGIDLVPHPPLVLKGDFHHQPFDNETFDFEFSNVFDHALYPNRFVAEIERTLKPGGICVLHVALSKRADKYSANDLYSVGPLLEMFRDSEMVRVRSVDGFGLDTEVVFRKRSKKMTHPSSN